MRTAIYLILVNWPAQIRVVTYKNAQDLAIDTKVSWFQLG